MESSGHPEAVNRAAHLRNRYPRFVFDAFTVSADPSRLAVDYFYSAPPDLRFKSSITFDRLPGETLLSPQALENLLFHIGLVESFSYWKATCSPILEVRPGRLNADQTAWWKNLLLHGMGEYFYVNRIPFSAPDFVTILAASGGDAPPPFRGELRRGLLIPLGGGRDSAVAAKLVQDDGMQPGFMILNEIPAALRVAKTLGCPHPILVRRALDPLILDLNRQGFLNGHVPFSATLAFLNAACLALYGYSVIGIANEKSSDEGNISYEGQTINHQYSKSSAFESSFNDYLNRYLLADARYLSLVRPLYELQIGRMFAHLDALHGAVSSCNRLQSVGKWCGECPKCLSVFATTYPFVELDALRNIFGSDDFFDRPHCAQTLAGLTGLGENKPFECVATYEETVCALALCVEAAERRKMPLSPGLQFAKDVILPRFPRPSAGAQEPFGNSDRLDRLPASIEAILRRELTA